VRREVGRSGGVPAVRDGRVKAATRRLVAFPAAFITPNDPRLGSRASVRLGHTRADMGDGGVSAITPHGARVRCGRGSKGGMGKLWWWWCDCCCFSDFHGSRHRSLLERGRRRVRFRRVSLLQPSDGPGHGRVVDERSRDFAAARRAPPPVRAEPRLHTCDEGVSASEEASLAEEEARTLYAAGHGAARQMHGDAEAEAAEAARQLWRRRFRAVIGVSRAVVVCAFGVERPSRDHQRLAGAARVLPCGHLPLRIRTLLRMPAGCGNESEHKRAGADA
jgi:hypothetical protein